MASQAASGVWQGRASAWPSYTDGWVETRGGFEEVGLTDSVDVPRHCG